MPTLPPRPAGSVPDESHRHRQIAQSFGADAERYDRTRPSYPTPLIERVLADSPGRDVLDVGIGTGIEARQFQDAGCAVLGVEPDERMAEFARRAGTDVEVATFETWDPIGRTFDVVAAGQAWHWIDPLAGALKAAQVLRPAGRIAAFWNVGQIPPEVLAALAEVYGKAAPDALAARAYRATVPALELYSAQFEKAAEGIRQATAFAEPEEWRFEWQRPYTRDRWLDQLRTQGDHSQFAPDQLAEVLAGVGVALDGLGGGFTMSYTAVAVTAVRRDPAS
jgi:SAM-dependent methyltransferase